MTIITYVTGADDAVMRTDIFQLSAFLPIRIINSDQVQIQLGCPLLLHSKGERKSEAVASSSFVSVKD